MRRLINPFVIGSHARLPANAPDATAKTRLHRSCAGAIRSARQDGSLLPTRIFVRSLTESRQLTCYFAGTVSGLVRRLFSGSKRPARVLIADDHGIVRMGVRALCAGHAQLEVCGEAADGRETVAKVAELAPDVVILDLSMPIMNGFEAAAEIQRIAPSTKIILFSLHDIPVTGRIVGADAFVVKSSAPTELLAAIERVLGLSGAAGAAP